VILIHAYDMKLLISGFMLIIFILPRLSELLSHVVGISLASRDWMDFDEICRK